MYYHTIRAFRMYGLLYRRRGYLIFLSGVLEILRIEIVFFYKVVKIRPVFT